MLDEARLVWDAKQETKRSILSTFESRHTVTQLVEALRYKPEGRGFDYRWYH